MHHNQRSDSLTKMSEELAYKIMKWWVRTYLDCKDLKVGNFGWVIVEPNAIIDGTPVLLVDGKAPDFAPHWVSLLQYCIGKRVSWFDSYQEGKSAKMPDTIEELMIQYDLTA